MHLLDDGGPRAAVLCFANCRKTKNSALTPEQFGDLFGNWRERYRAKVEIGRDRAIKNIIRITDEFAKIHPPEALPLRLWGFDDEPGRSRLHARADPALPRSGQSAARIVAHRNVIGIKFSVFDGHM